MDIRSDFSVISPAPEAQLALAAERARIAAERAADTGAPAPARPRRRLFPARLRRGGHPAAASR